MPSSDRIWTDAAQDETSPLLVIDGLTTEFAARGSGLARATRIRAVDDVSFAVAAGQSFGIVGESGSGKSTLARTILRLIPAAAGRVRYRGIDVLSLGWRQLRKLRSEIQIVFQDPAGSLNPRLCIETIIGEAAWAHGLVRDRRQMRERVAELLTRVGLSTAVLRRYPHEFSGGQKQRIGIARALSLSPRVLILDEPTSALDVSVQSQILDLLSSLKRDLRLTYLFVSHNLAVVRHFCDDVAVMRAGRIIEQSSTAELFERPQQAYTRDLLNAVLEPPTADQPS